MQASWSEDDPRFAYFCGSSWEDASETCGTWCPDDADEMACPYGECVGRAPGTFFGGEDSIGDVCGLIQRSRPTFTSHILSKYTDVQKFHNKDNLASVIPPADTPRRPRRRRTFRHRAPPVRPNRPLFPPWEPSSRMIPPITCSAVTPSTPPILCVPSTSTVPAGMPIAPRSRGAGFAIGATSGITSRLRRGDT